ncbi:MAG: TlyA family RNA methyltransferase [Lachnospiraceae bacterium]|jgi:23S rRNA (cytidine1920-2'-O)/16S rRNA (cytidine1409-2'-O)-methyltransferase|nr:TlyA family RNA methyltransferase [Lachnospiraceae bacterium]
MKERLDVLLVQGGFADSRAKAQALIMSGIVYVNGQKEDKPGAGFAAGARVEVRGKQLPYVSRGGLKLEKALDVFGGCPDGSPRTMRAAKPVSDEVDGADAVNVADGANVAVEAGMDVTGNRGAGESEPEDSPKRSLLAGMTCMDVGASTGGFTDCMLAHGARKVYAVDVGHGQLDWKLRGDARVVCMEKTNIRYVTPDMVGDVIDFATIDVSFISLTKVLGPVLALMGEGEAGGEAVGGGSGEGGGGASRGSGGGAFGGSIVALIKPQFEAGRGKVGKKGVVRDPAVHREVIAGVASYAEAIGLAPVGLTYSPIKGPEGNIEYLLWLRRRGYGAANPVCDAVIAQVVGEAHSKLG